jgi:hypothetical protein
MQIVEVNNPSLSRKFLQISPSLYKGDPNYIQPLSKDVTEVFDPAKNKTFRNGYCIRWILVNDKNETIGRIAAFVNDTYKTKGDTMKYGGCGFFECIDNQEAANLLFNTAKNWLQNNGCGGMDGPINFGERDIWWGLLIEGFDPPLYRMNYNPMYYKTLFENFGFKVFFNQLCFGRKLKVILADKFYANHAKVVALGGFNVKNINKNDLDKYANDFAIIYNKAWSGHGGLKQIALPTVKKMFNAMKPIMDENLIFFAYKNEEPVAFFINIPDLNFYFKRFNGKFGLLQKLQFLWMQKNNANPKAVGLVFGVIPEYQGQGVDSFIIKEASDLFRTDAVKYTDYEMQWIGDFNPKMINVCHQLDSEVTRKLATYRYHFDETIPVERHPQL